MAYQHPLSAMYAIDFPEKSSEPVTPVEAQTLKLVWSNPNPPIADFIEPKPLVECRSRRQARNILNAIGHGYIRERRQGDRLLLSVYAGNALSVIRRVPELRSAA